MMPKWPVDVTNAEDVYRLNELSSSFAGRYPVGENGCWHSGIHINRNSRFAYPLLDGLLAAYRISKDYKEVPRLSEIRGDERGKLQRLEQELYEENPTKGNMYRLKNNLTNEQKKILTEKYTDSFILCKHQVKLSSPPNKTLEFFTLYTNIIPYMKTTTEFSVLSAAPVDLPFYQKYRFRVSASPEHEYPYTTRNEKKLFVGSHCTVKEKNATTSLCNFDNFGNKTTYIEVPKNDITLFPEIPPTYRPNSGNVPIYKLDMPLADAIDNEKRAGYKLATLIRTKAYFQQNVKTCYEGYFSVLVNKNEVTIADGEQNPITDDLTTVIVKKSDLEREDRGCLKAGNSLCTEKVRGLRKYDAPAGNVRDIFIAGQEFELENGGQLLKNHRNARYYAALKGGGYLCYEKRAVHIGGEEDLEVKGEEDLEVKVEYDEDYTYNQTVIPVEPAALHTGMMLGYPVRPPSYTTEYYDAALFFGRNIFSEPEWEAEGYVIPAGTLLYEEAAEPGGVTMRSKGPSDTVKIAGAVYKTVTDRNGIAYSGFVEAGGRVWYMLSTEAERCRKNILEWDKYFKILNTEYQENTTDNLFIRACNAIKGLFDRDADREADRNGDIRYDGNPDWYKEPAHRESLGTKEIKRRIVCSHPLELDKKQYIKEDGEIIETIRHAFGVGNNRERREYFKKQVEAIDIWEGLEGKRIEGLSLEKNNFWFAHPIYFINHLYRTGLLGKTHPEELLRIQDEVVALPCLLINHKGIYPENYKKDPVPNGQTYCNQAAYLTIQALDNNFTQFTNTDGGFPEPEDADNYQYKNSNHWCDVLVEQAGKGIIVEFTGTVPEKEAKAQAKANEGYVVIAAWKNLKPKSEGGGGAPHFATVRPGFSSHPQYGPMLANVGSSNGVKWRSEGFPEISADKIHWYYNPNQDFQYKPEIIQNYKDYE
jgi:hypothetical protein